MGIETLLSRLQGVKSTGRDRWIARCPGHEDKSPSLTVRALPDGRILMHCFAGCDTEAVLSAAGLTFNELFPEPLTREPTGMKPIRGPFSAFEALQCLSHESAVVAICASDLAEGKTLSDEDAKRTRVAAGRIASVLEVIYA